MGHLFFDLMVIQLIGRVLIIVSPGIAPWLPHTIYDE